MANHQIKLNYCAECRQIDKENIFNCRWLQFTFCTLTCLKQFYAKIVIACDLCERAFDQNNRVHVRDDVPKHVENSYTFICDECLVGRSALATHCHYCTNICYKGFGAQLMTTTGVGAIMKYRCSIDCQAKVVNRKELAVCSVCDGLNKCNDISYNDQMLAICSTMCLEKFMEKYEVSIGNCDKCRLKFAFNVKHEHIVVDRLKRKMFCSKKCVYAYVRDDTEMVVCCMCQHRMEFYKCIRRCYDDRCFCSLGCIQAAEQNIERLLKNDEQFHLDILEFKCKSRMEVDMDSDVESDDLNQDCDLFNGETIKTKCNANDAGNVAQISNSERTAKVTKAVSAIQTEVETTTTTSTTAIPPSKVLERLLAAPKFRSTYDLSGIMKCGNCQSNMDTEKTIIQWEWLEFCNFQCFQSFILKYSHLGCTMCSEDCDFYCGLLKAHAFGNRLYFFCSDQCATVFFNSATFCKFCRRISDPAKMMNGFCQAVCQQKFDALYMTVASSTPTKQICCIECNSTTNLNIRLSFAGSIHGFCSYQCYFYRTLQCELFPEQCTMCQLYFVRDPCSKVSFTFRRNNTMNVFCSQSCQLHFIHKYQFIETCTICRRSKSNIKMTKEFIIDTRIHLSYCSMQCIQSVDMAYNMKKNYDLEGHKKSNEK